ncbi:MAG: FadR family transcriptional regulator [Rhodobacterales bacterium]|uniref:FadR/GntR family transcriptional regulator n=1 Tax=Gemmobacter nectariphilus TaxID=220343 RepID=UPI00042049F3|nr:FadR/GntR family transcriptional regulator [Gemmobacter nectariphilus]MDX5356874.1 FadR family transcriptional regulator [Rhodobacterales bacterium]MDX5499134.1 FadR family transcriptional regulator [Rhodobacterales bacterium]
MLTSADTQSRDANSALEELRHLIASPEWAQDGGKLPTERALTQRLGIGRHALRRALEVLEAEGLIWRKQGAGTFVGSRQEVLAEQISATIPRATYDEVMEVRLRLEPQIAQLAALRADDADVARMIELNRRSIEASDPESCELWDGAFHRQIAVAARNPMFLTLFDIMNRVRQEKAWQIVRDLAREGGATAASVSNQHVAIIEAIDARDPARAGAAMREHLLDLQMRLLRRLTSFDPVTSPVPTEDTLK